MNVANRPTLHIVFVRESRDQGNVYAIMPCNIKCFTVD